MKRSGPISRKTPLVRKTPMSRLPKQSIGKAKKLAWDWFSRFIRLRDSIRTCPTSWTRVCRCVTCGKVYPMGGKGCVQAGHFIPGRHNALLYDERNCHAQCYVCNVRRKGAWLEYERFMLLTYGPAVVAELKERDKVKLTMSAAEHLAVAAVYRGKVEGLGGWPE